MTSRRAWLGVLTAALHCGGAGMVQAETGGVAGYRIVGDAMPEPLGGAAGDAARGRRIVLDRATGNCLICHKVPEPNEAFQGDLGPDLAGVGARLDVAAIRLRVVDQSRVNPATVMPPYHRTEGLMRVAQPYRGQPILDEQAVEDVVAYLSALR